MRSVILVMLMVALLSGCAEVVNKVVIPPNFQANELSSIKVCRKRIFFGDGGRITIYLDKLPIITSPAGHCFAAKVAPGLHSIDIDRPDESFLFNIAKGENKFFITTITAIEETDKAGIDEYSHYKQMIVQD